MPPREGLTPEEIDALVAEMCDGDGFQRRQREDEEQIVEDLLAPDENGRTPPVASRPARFYERPTPGFGYQPRERLPDLSRALPPRRPPVTRQNAMTEAFRLNYGFVAAFEEDRLQGVLRRLGMVTNEGREAQGHPPINSVWLHRDLPGLQVQVAEWATATGAYLLRPLGQYRPALPRTITMDRRCFFSWFVPRFVPLDEDTSTAEAREAFREPPKKAKPKPRPKPPPKPAPTVWERLMTDDDED